MLIIIDATAEQGTVNGINNSVQRQASSHVVINKCQNVPQINANVNAFFLHIFRRPLSPPPYLFRHVVVNVTTITLTRRHIFSYRYAISRLR